MPLFSLLPISFPSAFMQPPKPETDIPSTDSTLYYTGDTISPEHNVCFMQGINMASATPQISQIKVRTNHERFIFIAVVVSSDGTP